MKPQGGAFSFGLDAVSHEARRPGCQGRTRARDDSGNGGFYCECHGFTADWEIKAGQQRKQAREAALREDDGLPPV